MTQLADGGVFKVDNQRLEYRMAGLRPDEAPTLVLLHEGLGSAALWGDFPKRLSEATGTGVFAYSRAGYGSSSPAALPRTPAYMHEEANRILPALLDQIGFQRGLLVGHSDGASIATLYLGSHQDHRVRGLVLAAPHFVVEDINLEAIQRAKAVYEEGPLKEKLARWHQDVEGAFRGWNEAWLDPAFRDWDISDSLGYIRVPIQILHGETDPYGTARQIEVAEEECYCPVEVRILPGIGHNPFREASNLALQLISGFVNRVLDDHGERELPRAA